MHALKVTLLIALLPLSLHAQDINIEALPKAKRFDWYGSVSSSASIYGASGIENRSNPFSWNISGTAGARILETWDLPFTFSINQYGTTVTKPFYQFGISPRYKWATLHLGHRSLSFNPYTLSGHTFFGVGAELTPGRFRFATMWGKLRPAVEIDTATGAINIPSFKRTGYGVKIGYGTQQSFVDLVLFKAKDDSASIRNWQGKEYSEKTSAQVLTPGENVAAGLSAAATVFKSLRMNADFGLSIYNRDIRETAAFSDIGIMRLTESTSIRWAGKAGLSYSWKSYVLRADYERVQHDYATMGAYFFNNDFENITLSPSGSLWDGKLVAGGSIGVQRNNLAGDRASSTRRVIGNAAVTIAPAQAWGVNLAYNNFSVNQTAGTVPLSDSFRIRQVSQTASVSPYYNIARDTAVTHTFNANVNMQTVTDRNVLTKQYGEMKTRTLGLNHATTFLRASRSISSGINYNHILVAGIINTQTGATLGYGQSFLKSGALTASATATYNISNVNGARDGNIVNATLSGAYAGGKRHSFALSLNVIRSSSKAFASYTETIGTLSYSLLLK